MQELVSAFSRMAIIIIFIIDNKQTHIHRTMLYSQHSFPRISIIDVINKEFQSMQM